jgi:hypothetical protein
MPSESLKLVFGSFSDPESALGHEAPKSLCWDKGSTSMRSAPMRSTSKTSTSQRSTGSPAAARIRCTVDRSDRTRIIATSYNSGLGRHRADRKFGDLRLRSIARSGERLVQIVSVASRRLQFGGAPCGGGSPPHSAGHQRLTLFSHSQRPFLGEHLGGPHVIADASPYLVA